MSVRYPSYSDLRKREHTFTYFPLRRLKRWNILAEAGFIYTGDRDVDDRVTCFFCNGALFDWNYNDDPWVEHARWFPDCHFVKSKKGQQFINDIHIRNQQQPQFSENINRGRHIASTPTAPRHVTALQYPPVNTSTGDQQYRHLQQGRQHDIIYQRPRQHQENARQIAEQPRQTVAHAEDCCSRVACLLPFIAQELYNGRTHPLVPCARRKPDWRVYQPNFYVDRSDDNPVPNATSSEHYSETATALPQLESGATTNSVTVFNQDERESIAVLTVRSFGYSFQAIRSIKRYLRSRNVGVTAVSICDDIFKIEEQDDRDDRCMFRLNKTSFPTEKEIPMSITHPPIICDQCLKDVEERIRKITEELSQPNATVTDYSMAFILDLIGSRFPQYHIPSDMDKFFEQNGIKPLNTSHKFAQVIFVPANASHNIGHFVLLTNIAGGGEIQLMDSLRMRSSEMDKTVKEIIKQLLGVVAGKPEVEEISVSAQIGNIDCGLYAIACLIDICLGNGDRLENVVYNQEHMRRHLIDTILGLLKNEPLEAFPTATIVGEKRQKKVFTF